MKTLGKVVDATVIVGSVVIGVGAVRGIASGAKMKSKTAIALASLTLIIAVYATREAVNKINA